MRGCQCVLLLLVVALCSAHASLPSRASLSAQPSLPSQPSLSSSLLIRVSTGLVNGTSLTPTCNAWLGIPYAQPPIGPLRFQSSRPRLPWSNIFPATSFGPGCPQTCLLPPGTCPVAQSEDCLSLNVFVPSSAKPSSSLPVLVFFPGGRFEQGASDTYLYDGRSLVQHGLVVVTVNYRLGALGFLYLPDGVPGSFGVQDQLVALKWIRSNIAAFGGNPNDVTIDGQSAGGASVAYHVLSPLSAGLFHRAIVQSNPWALPWKERVDGAKLGDIFAQRAGCRGGDVAACLRSKSVAELLQAQHEAQRHFSPLRPLDIFLPWTPMVGTGHPTALAMQPLAAFLSDRVANRVPIVAGVVANETMIFVYQGLGSNPSEALYLAFLSDVFGIHAARVIERYPPHQGGRTILHTLSLLGTDYIMACPARALVRRQVGDHWCSGVSLMEQQAGRLYYFDHIMSFSQEAWGANYTECYDLVCHGEELVFQFGTASIVGFKYTSAEQQLITAMQSAWAGYAHGSSPWPVFANATQASMLFTAPGSRVAPFPRQSFCDFWDSVGYGRAGRFAALLRRYFGRK